MKLFSYLLICSTLATTFISQQAGAWGSATKFETHQYIDKLAYTELQKDPALVDSGFPTIDQILANEGVYYLGDGDSIWSPEYVGGPGPDRPGTTDDGDHYYNPRTGLGNGPGAVALRLRYLAQSNALSQGKEIGKKSAAWGAHYMADMSVVYHISGIPKSDLLTYFNALGGSAAPSVNLSATVTGPLASLSYHTVFTHGPDFKKEVVRFLTEALKPENKNMNWFDPWYWNGASSATKGSSHIEWEMYNVAHPGTYNLSGYNLDWTNPSPTFNEPWLNLATPAAALARSAANEALSNLSAWAADPADALQESVRNVLTIWRASFSALRPSITFEILPADTSEENPEPQYLIKGHVKNLSTENANFVQVKLTLISGGEFLTGEQDTTVAVIPINPGSTLDIGEWKIKVTDPKKCQVLIETIGQYKLPDLQYARKIELIKKPELDGNYVGKYTGQAAGTIRFTVKGTSVNGTISGTYDNSPVEGTFSGSVTASGQIKTALSGVIHGTGFNNEPWDIPFTGEVNGSINGTTGSGTWWGKNKWGEPKGSWTASKQ